MYTLLTGLWRQWTAYRQYNILILGRQKTGKTTLFQSLKRLNPHYVEDCLTTQNATNSIKNGYSQYNVLIEHLQRRQTMVNGLNGYNNGQNGSNTTNSSLNNTNITPPQTLPLSVSKDYIPQLENALTLTKFYAPTIGLNSTKTLVEEGLQFQLWDLGGQAKLRPMWPHYYLETHAIIYVHDYNGDGDGYNDARSELYKLMSQEALLGVPIAIILTKCPQSAEIIVKQLLEQQEEMRASGEWVGGQQQRQYQQSNQPNQPNQPNFQNNQHNQPNFQNNQHNQPNFQNNPPNLPKKSPNSSPHLSRNHSNTNPESNPSSFNGPQPFPVPTGLSLHGFHSIPSLSNDLSIDNSINNGNLPNNLSNNTGNLPTNLSNNNNSLNTINNNPSNNNSLNSFQSLPSSSSLPSFSNQPSLSLSIPTPLPLLDNNSSLGQGTFASSVQQPGSTSQLDGLTPHHSATRQTNGLDGNVGYNNNNNNNGKNDTNNPTNTSNPPSPHRSSRNTTSSLWESAILSGFDDNNSLVLTNPAYTHPWIDFYSIGVRLGVYHILSYYQKELFIHHNSIMNNNTDVDFQNRISFKNNNNTTTNNQNNTFQYKNAQNLQNTSNNNHNNSYLEDADVSVDPYITSFGLLNNPTATYSYDGSNNSGNNDGYSYQGNNNNNNNNNNTHSYNNTNNNPNQQPDYNTTFQSFINDTTTALSHTSLGALIGAIADSNNNNTNGAHGQQPLQQQQNQNYTNQPSFLPLDQNTHVIRLFVLDEYPSDLVGITAGPKRGGNSGNSGNGGNNRAASGSNNNNNLSSLQFDHTDLQAQQQQRLYPQANQIAQVVQWLADVVSASERAGVHLTG